LNQSLLSLLLSTAVLGGCTVEAPWGINGVEGRHSYPCFPDGTCDEGLSCAAGAICIGGSGSCTLQNALTVEPLPSSTIHDKIAVRGSVTSDASAVIVSAGAFREWIPTTGGSFCIEVPLEQEGKPTRISVVARNDDDCVTPWTTYDVTFNPNGENVVAGRTPRGPWPRVSNLTDGSLNTSMQFSFRDERDPPETEVCDTFTYLWFDFETEKPLHRLVVRYPDREDFERYILCWSLLYSTENNPGTPYPARSRTWTSLGQSAEGRPDSLIYDFESVVQAKHIALLVFEDGKRGDTEDFEIAELEVYSPPNETPFVGCQ
jgi:hypothetical protein